MTAAVVVTPVPAHVPDHVLVMALHGALDYTNADRLREELTAAVGEGHRELLLDLSALSFCDSTGIRILLSVRKLLQERDGGVTLAGMNPRLARIFRTTGLIHAFTVEPDLTEAVGSLNARPGPE
ncbi:STAS domain-containing protein [Microbispora triticiradicis]|nr:STAS domain-containing protein [Microbispora fusca]